MVEINYNVVMEIDTSGSEDGQPTWSNMGTFAKNLSQSLNEVLYQATYYADGGWGSTEVTGGQWTCTLTGDKIAGDPACEYIFDKDRQHSFGESRKAKIRIRRGTDAIVWNVTLANITDALGDANQPNAVTVTIHSNGKPSFETAEV